MALLGSLLVASTAGATHDAAVVDVGTLDLVLGSSGNSFQFTPTGAASPTGSQPLTENRCKINSAEPLVDLSATSTATGGPSPEPGLKDSVMGVKAKGEGNGEPCARIDNVGDQMLIFELQSDPTEFFEDKFIHGAQFGLKLKFGATAKVTLFDSLGAEVTSNTAECVGSDCGADSGGDQVLLTLPAHSTSGTPTDYLGTKLVFEVVGANASGAFGVLDNPVAGFDSFITIAEQFDGELDCGDTTDPISQTASAVDGQYWRLANGDGSDCAPKPYNADVNETQEGVVTFFPAPAPGQDKAYFLGQFVGTEATQPATQQRTLQYDDVPPPGPFNPMQWCVVVENTGIDNATVPAQWTGAIKAAGENQRKKILESVGDDPSTTDKIEFYPQLPDGNEPPQAGEETWCLVRSESVAREGEVVRTFDTYGFGDPYKIY